MYLMLFLIGGLGTQELLIIALVIFVLFGATKLPQLAKALGQSKRAFREGQEEAEEEERRAKARKELQGTEPAGALSAVDDEALFEEARRRAAAARTAETSKRD